jgi:Cu/Ag efflux protein CusF
VRLYKAIVLANLALVVGLLAGSLWWRQEVARLEREVERARQAPTPGAGPASWTVRGIVRGSQPRDRAVVITHEPVPGLMGAMTIAFRLADPRLTTGLAPGDRVEFTLVATGQELLVVTLRKVEAP